jgi:hypothetical protein
VEYANVSSIRFGPVFLLLQIFTNETIRDISLISLKILPTTIGPYTSLLALAFIFSVYMKSNQTKKI